MRVRYVGLMRVNIGAAESKAKPKWRSS
jgi:hypothetical protein